MEWPSYIKFSNDTSDPQSSMYYDIHYDDIEQEGNSISLYLDIKYGNYDDPNKIFYNNISFSLPWTIFFKYFPYNEPPFYNLQLPNKIVIIGQTVTQSTGVASADTTDVRWTVEG